MFKRKTKKLAEVFITKFNESSLELQKGLQSQTQQLRERLATTSGLSKFMVIKEHTNLSIQYVDKLRKESCKTLDKYLRLLKPSEINIVKFYETIRPTIDGHIDGHVNSLTQKKNELVAQYGLQEMPHATLASLDTQISGINNFKRYFKNEICDVILFDYNIQPMDAISRTQDQIWLLVVGAIIGNVGFITQAFIAGVKHIISLFYSKWIINP